MSKSRSQTRMDALIGSVERADLFLTDRAKTELVERLNKTWMGAFIDPEGVEP